MTTRAKPLEPPRWDDQQLDSDRRKAIEIFRRARMQEPLEQYLQVFEERQGAFEVLLEKTVDLNELSKLPDRAVGQPIDAA